MSFGFGNTRKNSQSHDSWLQDTPEDEFDRREAKRLATERRQENAIDAMEDEAWGDQ